MSDVATVSAYALREALRRRVFFVVLALTVVYLTLYWLGVDTAFEELEEFTAAEPLPVDEPTLAAATLFGLSMFGTLFLGAVLAAFLTLGAVRGDAETGVLQPLLARPLGRSGFLLARFLAAAVVCVPYVLVVYTLAALITRAVGGWWPDQLVAPGLELAAGVLLIAALSLLGSIFLSTVANGIAIFMIFGAGLVAGLLGQIGEALNSETLESVGRIASWAVPFEALYQDALYRITSDTGGVTGFILSLGPFGGAQGGGEHLPLWTAVYLAAVALVSVAAFARRDL
jgi:Cu-processing system permease protein